MNTKPIERLADALQVCFSVAVKQGIAEVSPQLDRVDKRLARMDERLARMDQRLDRQDATMRLFWQQLKGDGKLPIDE